MALMVAARPVTSCLYGLLVLVLALGLSACGGVTGGSQEPVVADYAIAYVKRPVPVEDDDPTELVEPDVRNPIEFNAGGDVYIRDRAATSAAERNITACITGGTGDVKDLETSYDGTKLIFSLRLEDPDPNDDEVPTWNIYEYDTTVGGCPTRVIGSNTIAENGDDLAPYYLPGGRIVFTSNRQEISRKLLLDEGKEEYLSLIESRQVGGEQVHALVLHTMSATGTDPRQISFNQSHDLDPSVMANGEILFTRWDDAGPRNAMSLYTARPDGTEMHALFGVHNHNVGTNNSTVQFLSAREIDDGRVLAIIKPFTDSAGGGAPVLIDVQNYADNTVPTWPNQGFLSGTAMQNAVNLDVRTDGSISRAGRFRSVHPLPDGTNRALVSWSQCRLLNDDDDPMPCPSSIPANAEEAFPLYGIYIYDISDNTQRPVVVPQEGIMIDEPVVLAPRTMPAILFDKSPGIELVQDLIDENVGLLHIRSVYDFDGNFNNLGLTGTLDLATMANPTLTNADQRPARYLRLVKAVSIPDEDVRDIDNSAFGVNASQGMREILGYIPIEPDGSVLVKVPSNVPVAFSIVDKEGRRITARHQNWFQIKAGETVTCNGCHNHNANPSVPHGYRDDHAALNAGAPTSGMGFPGTTGVIVPEMSETMAEAKARNNCPGGSGGINYPTCMEITPSVTPSFTDIWSNTPIPMVNNLAYNDPDSSIISPVSPSCLVSWEAICRIMISYETHIEPLWSSARTNMAMEDRTCIACHTNSDAMDNPMVPDGQLDLSDDPQDGANDPNISYQELFLADDVQVLDGGGALVDAEQIIGTDELGDPIFDTIPVPGGPSMSPNGARASRFFNCFLPGSVSDCNDHVGDLSAAEIRLLAEWLDIGAQYYNNPLAAPTN